MLLKVNELRKKAWMLHDGYLSGMILSFRVALGLRFPEIDKWHFNDVVNL